MNSPSNSKSESRPQQVPLPDSVEASLQRICSDQSQPKPSAGARLALASIGEESALQVLNKISASTIKRSFDGFIYHMVKRARSTGGSASPSPIKSSSCEQNLRGSPFLIKAPNFNDDGSARSPVREFLGENSLPGPENATSRRISPFEALDELEFQKAFLLLSYVGREKFERVISAEYIRQLKDLRMGVFESKVWETLRGSALVTEKDRRFLEWDSGMAHLYHCHVSSDGSYQFKGPFLNQTRTLLQKIFGDENVILVKLERVTDSGTDLKDSLMVYRKIAKDGICVGSRRYRFFVFKDGGKEERKKGPTTSSVRCYFVNLEGHPSSANKSVPEARCLFMHVHKLSSISNYMTRFSLILSKTVSLEVDFEGVNVEVIPDIECRDGNGNTIYDKKGKRMIHTDGTGFVSADIALKCKGNIWKGKSLNGQTLAGCGKQTSGEMGRLKSCIDEPVG